MRFAAFFFVVAATTLVSYAVESAPRLGAGGPGGQTGDKQEESTEEQTLRAAGLSTDGEALLEFFRERVQPKADLDELLKLARQLGDANAQTRAKAAAKLVARGPSAVPALRHVLNELDNTLAAQQARHCLECLEAKRSAELSMAAAKLLGMRQPAAATETLLAFLPLADDEAVVGAVKAALDNLAARPDPLDAALVAALHDPLPLRRAIAAAVLAGSGRAEVLPEVRKLLTDAKPLVRLHAGLALTLRLDEQAVSVLIDLLAELPGDERQQAEKALQQLAGEWSPSPPLPGDDELSLKIRREAWAGWWRTLDGPALMAAFRRRTLSKEDLAGAESLIDQLGDTIFARRERATTELLAMGPKVLGLLREAVKSKDLERARRAQICLKRITESEEKGKLPSAAPRLLAVRKPAEACAALLDFIAFTDESSMKEEIGKALRTLAIVSGQPDPAVLTALIDPLSVRRLAAAEALIGAGGATQWPVVRKLLADADPEVRLRVALALIRSQDKEAVPTLIDLVAELPRESLWEAEDLLQRLAGGKGPPHPPGDDAPGRQKLRDAWQAWWKDHAAAVNLAELDKTVAIPTMTVISENKGIVGGGFNPAAGGGNGGRLVALDRNGQQLWKIENVDHPIDFQVLGGDKVLIAEYSANRVTERDIKGKILWEVTNLPGSPINVQRLANGNTFIAVYNAAAASSYYLMEVDRQGKTVGTITRQNKGAGPPIAYLRGAFKMGDGQVVCLLSSGTCLRIDGTGKDIKSFPVNFAHSAIFNGNVDVTAKGHIVLVQPNNTVVEYDPDGKMVWQANAAGNRATRLANGNTLVASEVGGVIELDNTGKTVWQYPSPAGYQVLRARRVGDLGVAPRPVVKPAATFKALPVPNPQALARKSSPADALKRGDIPAASLAKLGSGNGDAPKELVAVLGRVGDPQIVSLALTRDGRSLVAGGIRDNKAQIFDLASGKQLKTPSVPGMIGNLVSISPDGTTVAMTGSRPTLELVETATGQLRTTINSTAPGRNVLDVVFSPDGKTVGLGDNAGMVILHELSSGKNRTLAGHATSVTKLAFSPDGKFLASAGGSAPGNRDVVISEVATGNILGRLPGHSNTVLGLAWHPNGKFLATGSFDGSIRLWDLQTMTPTQMLRAGGTEVHSLAWHPSGDFLASGEHGDGTVTLWDLRAAPPRPRVIRLFPNDASSKAGLMFNNDVLFTPEGRHLIAANSDGTISVLRLAEVGQLIK